MNIKTLKIMAILFLTITTKPATSYEKTDLKSKNIQAVVLAAGKSSRFKTGITKLVYPICGQAMIVYPVKLLQKLNIPTTLIVGYQQDLIIKKIREEKLANINFVEQKKQNGTGHALLCSKSLWNTEDILVLNGDCPLLTQDTIQKLISTHTLNNSAISFVVAFNDWDKKSYGRIVQKNGTIKIVEAKHFTKSPQEHPYINAGIYLINRKFLENFLDSVKANEITHEFYITDLVEIASKNSLTVKIIEAPLDKIEGINTLSELTRANLIKQSEIIEYWMTNGVHFDIPMVHIDLNVTIKPGTFIGTGAHIIGKTSIGKNCHIGPYSILKDTVIKDNTKIPEFSIIKR